MTWRTRRVGIALAACLIVLLAVAASARASAARFRVAMRGGLARQAVEHVTQRTANTIAGWFTDRRLGPEFWSVEDAKARETLPTDSVIRSAPPTARSSAEFAARRASAPPSWSRSHGDNSSDKYSSAHFIDRTNVRSLEVAWTYETPDAAANIQSTPVYTGNLLVFPNARHEIVGVDPATGRTVWTFAPGISAPARRGLVYWPGDAQTAPRIYFAALGRLYALDAGTGVPVREFHGGSIAVGYEVRTAPAISGSTLLVASLRPALHAFDVRSGQALWRAELLAQGPAARAERAAPGQRPYEAGRPWGGFSVDDARGLAFLSTSNPAPVGDGIHRRGKNAYSNSVVAIRIADGTVAWDFQEIAHDLWDLDIPAPPVLATIRRGSAWADVVVAVTKAGNSIVLDRETGKPSFDWHLRRAPTSLVPGERTEAYQPEPVLPEPFAREDFRLDDVTDIGAANRASVLGQLRDATFGFYAPHRPGHQSVFFGLNGGATQMGPSVDRSTGLLFVAATHIPSMFTIIAVDGMGSVRRRGGSAGAVAFKSYCASCHGATPASGGQAPPLDGALLGYDPPTLHELVRRGFQAMPANPVIRDAELDSLSTWLLEPLQRLRSGAASSGSPVHEYARTPYRRLRDAEGFPGSKPPWGTLNALDLNTGRLVWRVPLGRYQQLIDRGLPPTGTENFGGPMVTAGGLVFVSGTKDRLIRAFDVSNGAELWEHELPFAGSASPMTFVHRGRQYVVVPATGLGTIAIYDASIKTGSTFVAFALPESKAAAAGNNPPAHK